MKHKYIQEGHDFLKIIFKEFKCRLSDVVLATFYPHFKSSMIQN